MNELKYSAKYAQYLRDLIVPRGTTGIIITGNSQRKVHTYDPLPLRRIFRGEKFTALVDTTTRIIDCAKYDNHWEKSTSDGYVLQYRGKPFAARTGQEMIELKYAVYNGLGKRLYLECWFDEWFIEEYAWPSVQTMLPSNHDLHSLAVLLDKYRHWPVTSEEVLRANVLR